MRQGARAFAVIELSTYSQSSEDLRVIPDSALSYDDERGHFLCCFSERSIRNAPKYSGPDDWLDDTWVARLDAYFARFHGL